jgi:hypothetical protein
MIVQNYRDQQLFKWENKMSVSPVENHWGGIMTLDDSNVLVIFDNGGCKTQKVTLN